MTTSPITTGNGTLPAHAGAVCAADLDHCCAELAGTLTQMSGRKVLLTGGAGFLGYYLVQTLLEWNTRVTPSARVDLTVVDNYARGVPAWLGRFGSDQLRLVAHDIVHPLPDELGDFDYIVHAASIASPTFYRQHPIATMDANVTGLRLLLERVRAQQERGAGAAGFLFFSSSEIYGDPEASAIPTPETYPGRVSSTGPRACYDESKRFGETLCVNFARQFGLPVTMVRPFNNYGPGLQITDRRVIPDLARDLFGGADLVLHSDGSPTRTFCYVADAIVGYCRVLVHGRPGEAYNIGCESPEITIDELAHRIAGLGRDLFGYRGQVVRRVSADAQYLTDNPQRRCPDISKARREVNFAPRFGLDEGLRRTLLWYAENGGEQTP
jgi:UDP-glucuronate decarboxylase